MYTGYMAGATIVYIIPVALKILNKKDQPYLALGMMSGLISVPIGVLVAGILTAICNPVIRETISTNTEATYQLSLSNLMIFRNLIPIIVICLALVIGLNVKPNIMIKGFCVFGKVMDSALTIILMLCIVEYFTGIFSKLFGGWGFEPIIADEKNLNRALETAGYIGIMLCGAFPMVWLIQRYLSRPLEFLGRKIGLSENAVAGIFAGAANVLALLKMTKDMKAEDKVICLAYAVCGSFVIGDHLSFTANYQPNLILPVMLGKLTAACAAVIFAKKVAVPKAIEMESCREQLF